MKFPVRILVQSGILLSVLALGAFAAPEPTPAAFRTEVDIQPASPGAFLLSARVTDLASGDVLAVPSLKVAAGQEANAESTVPGAAEAQVTFSGKVDPERQTATYSVRVTRAGQVISEHSASLALH